MNLANALNTGWMWKCRPEARAYRRATNAVTQTQAALLEDIISRNQSTVYGLQHGFNRIRTSRDFQQCVPLSNYNTYAEFIHRISEGEANVLTREPVRLFEPTSGTTGGEKLIPYTKSLSRQFRRAVSAWIADILCLRPAVRRGRAYWSISPAFGGSRTTVGGIPIGFEEDAAYLGGIERLFLKKLLIVPPVVARIRSIENFRYCTLLHLLQAEDLSLISVWNPTFLTALLEPLEAWIDRICFDIRNGSLSLPTPGNVDPPKQLCPKVNIRRTHQLASIFRSSLSLSEKLQRIWPQLALISCWADAAAGRYVPRVRELFPSVEIHPKGLIATEGCVSFPLIDRTGAALALRAHFFEFAEVDSFANGRSNTENCRLAHELSRGRRYQVIITTGGGLYRYQLYDIVEVVGFVNQCPLLRFVGKSDCGSDLVGEKLSEPHVRDVLNRVFAAHGISPGFSLLVPVEGYPPRYRLYIQGSDLVDTQAFACSLCSAVQSGLEENPYYRQAVQLHQLSPLELHLLDPSREPASLVYERACLARGQKAGEVKPTALDSWTGWANWFDFKDSTVGTLSHQFIYDSKTPPEEAD